MKVIKKMIFMLGLLASAVLLINAYQGTMGTQEQKEPKSTTNAATIAQEEEKSLPNDYAIHALDIPMNLTFAGERVPLNDQEVFERVDREFLVNTYWQSNALLLFKRANKFFPIIEPILKEEQVPDDFKYLAVIESGLQNVRSPAGARGFWQIMTATGKELGLEVNANIDERYHLEKATRAACKYLKQAQQKFGSWTLAASAYNAGNSRIKKELEKQQVTGYYNLLLTEETARYVPRILALKTILSHPKQYGFYIKAEQLYYPDTTRTVLIDSTLNNLSSFAASHGTNYKQLKRYNPWLRQHTLRNTSRKEYQIKIPVK
jgi:hypothetical protein